MGRSTSARFARRAISAISVATSVACFVGGSAPVGCVLHVVNRSPSPICWMVWVARHDARCQDQRGAPAAAGGRLCSPVEPYDPSAFNDRLLLGLKGTMSEAELHILRARLNG